MVILKIILALVAFSFIVCFHELFHLIAAKLVKVPTVDFSVGMGKSLIAYQDKKIYFLGKHQGNPINKNKMSYHIRMLPVGGFVSFENVADTKDFDISKSEYYTKVHPLRRIFITAAGPIGNFILAFLLMFYFTAPVTDFNATTGKVSSVDEGSWADVNGIVPGDVIKTVNGIEMNNDTNDRMQMVGNIKKSNEICIEYLQNGQNKTLCKEAIDGMESIGVSMKIGFWESVSTNYAGTMEFIKITFDSLINLFTNFEVQNLSGPIGTVDTMQQSIDNIDKFVLILILINVSLGLFNLLFPISTLDGGKIVIDLFCLIVRKRYVKTTILDVISIVVIISLFLFTGVLDIQRIAERIF